MKGESEITEGKVNGDDISFVENADFQGMPIRIVYKGKIAATRSSSRARSGYDSPKSWWPSGRSKPPILVPSWDGASCNCGTVVRDFP
jgi:hypothetical protein